jgi:hypothetical protein
MQIKGKRFLIIVGEGFIRSFIRWRYNQKPGV